uniref:non-specific serine/threonine protein kinase n=1 Tax=Leersia perrieri TaxID=77586 RepID=A0A0D9XWK7_9ORYZ
MSSSTVALCTAATIVIVFLSLSRPSAARDSLLRGASIAVEDHATDLLLSPDGTFAAGFYAVSPTVFTFSVWFARAADRAVVWTATPRLLNSGNLAVEDAVGNVLWQSFDHPTDTLLPMQRLAAGKAMVSSDKLLAGGGFYSFRFNDYSIISLVYDNHEISSVYWPNPFYSYWQNNRNIYYNSTRRQAFIDESGHFLASDNATFDAADHGENVRRRLKLDTDGNLRLYSLELDDVTTSTWTWSVTWMAFANPAGVRLRADTTDWSRGCRPTFTFNSTDRIMKLLPLPHTDFWGFDINKGALLSLRECAARCKSEPSCVAFEYKVGIGECYPKSLMFNGRTFPGLLGTAYVKVPADLDVSNLHVHQWQKNGLAIEEDIVRCGATIDSPEFLLNVSGVSSSSSSNSIWFYFYGFLSAFFVIEVIVIAFGCWFFSSKGVFRPSKIWALDEGYRMVTNHFRAYSYSELQRGTRKFRSEIGRGKHRILVYEYIENGSLAQVLFDRRDYSKFLGWKQRFNIALGVAKGLAYLHNECLEWIIHCDMKPENILLDEDMEPKITDFGLSKLLNRDGYGSQMSRIRGTRGYLAPEWVSSLPITDKVDVYSYGVVLLELVKGRRISD